MLNRKYRKTLQQAFYQLEESGAEVILNKSKVAARLLNSLNNGLHSAFDTWRNKVLLKSRKEKQRNLRRTIEILVDSQRRVFRDVVSYDKDTKMQKEKCLRYNYSSLYI